ncbi:DDX5 isoform 11 [Pan troglodytes]|uniref:DEAD-box helicase 5 n=12 Tax=Catarrhini TaxID=9526 RepID=X6RLV5_HUMAN|nr:DEAD-box helicase 5 [Homo sapiens]KAI4051132.1 DEAD-box helicase 5 [Homo sapiens]PNJ01212.1 DDX5 isoform 11 [Pan troglodytes]PNJ50797.1 DDX5 isoform 3 [Pongo abelii]
MSGYSSDRDRGRDRGFGAPRFGGSRAGPLSGKKFGNPGEKLVKKKWNLDELPKFEKNFYQEHPDLARRTAQMSWMLLQDRISLNPLLFKLRDGQLL